MEENKMKKIYKAISVMLVLVTTLSVFSVIATASRKPTITVDTVSANPGDTIKVEVKISGNTGVAGALLKISYDSKLTLTGAENGDAFGRLTFTKPGKYGKRK